MLRWTIKIKDWFRNLNWKSIGNQSKKSTWCLNIQILTLHRSATNPPITSNVRQVTPWFPGTKNRRAIRDHGTKSSEKNEKIFRQPRKPAALEAPSRQSTVWQHKPFGGWTWKMRFKLKRPDAPAQCPYLDRYRKEKEKSN